jgi:uncharacterized repeat protein (TIGR04138 family)
MDSEQTETMPEKTFEEVVAELGRYPVDAFEFVRDGLQYTVRKIHGDPGELERKVQEWMAQREISADKLATLYENGELPEKLGRAVEKLGGPAALNRHVDGRKLCFGLRDLAIEKWGLMASTVLANWNIRRTDDFGAIVFALVNNDFLQKQPDDSVDDFKDVFDFSTTFDHGYEIELADS